MRLAVGERSLLDKVPALVGGQASASHSSSTKDSSITSDPGLRDALVAAIKARAALLELTHEPSRAVVAEIAAQAAAQD